MTCIRENPWSPASATGSNASGEHVENLLDYCALLSASLPLYHTDINLDELADQLRETMAEQIRQKSVALTVDVERGPSGGPPELMGDARRIRQMLVELLGNAVKFTPAGGRVGLRVTGAGQEVKFEVSDTGPGIQPDALRTIWLPFTQAAKGDAERPGGLGLGLAIVKELAAALGGRVEVATQPGHGSQFTVFVPAHAITPRASGAG